MSDLRKKLNAVKKFFTKKPQYTKFHNYDPKNPFPDGDETYKKFPLPEPPQKGEKRKQSGGKRKQSGGKRKQKGGKRKQKGGKRKQRGGKKQRYGRRK